MHANTPAQPLVWQQPPHVGQLLAGPRNSIADVGEVTVGHKTLNYGDMQTGVTVIKPHSGDAYRARVPAAAAVINGFGKSLGLLQLEELGQIETPIALTNTFSVPAVAQAQIRACIKSNPEVGRRLPTVNPLVLECNDGVLNDIQRMAVTELDYFAALAAASPQFTQGSVGAGRGMSSFQLKGGVGSASRKAPLNNGHTYTVGALVLANFGQLPNLIWNGQHVGPALCTLLDEQARAQSTQAEKGSIIMVLATDAPLESRQLRRLAMRAAAGLARTGSVYGHGSGDIALAFSTAYQTPADTSAAMPPVAMVHEGLLDPLFQAAADSVEQAIIHALWHAETVSGRSGHVRQGIRPLLAQLAQSQRATRPS